MSTRRVVVTGMGIISPVGNDIARAWMNIREGLSGVGLVTENDLTGFATRIAGEVRDFDVEEYMSMRDARRMDRFMHYGIAAAIDAVKDAGLEVTEENSHRIGVSMGAGIGGLATIEENHNKLLAGGARKVSPFFIPGSIINMTSGNISIMGGITGPNLSIV
ncbi:MAG: beta-ketoacyl synthase N-terminal-like domain-containing protein, partial [Pseudomonadota bacterium]|nr:beta-ketoacyl synthase N-terminal-like domain-containing protein [Pseudomonadota bacterium]